ncbi:MAG: DUF1934 domain-containing protein [Roseburia sp.]|nr:DUF1934 domain-containing protein [Roseburia sp.]
MTKDVLVKIKGLQFAGEEDADATEVITSGTYYMKNGKHYILYDEVMEDSTEVTKNVIKIWENNMDVTRKGPASVHMMFEKGKKNVSYYYTPYGNLLIGIDAKDVQVEETEYDINIQVKYGLEINYEHMADCHITVNVKSKEARNFKI